MSLNTERLQTRLFPRPFKFYQRLDSTQNVALQWLQDGGVTGAVVIADEQLSGRGRKARAWSTPPGAAIALSIILRPTVTNLPQVMMLGALGISQWLDSLGVKDVTIKWPNDVRIRGRKVCGVLPEAVWNGDQLAGVALGIGVNIRNDFSATPLDETAISLEPELKQRLDRAECIAAIVTRIDGWIGQLGSPALFKAWQARLETIGQQVVVEGAAGVIRGVAESVDGDGALLIRDVNGGVRRILAGDIIPL